MLANRLVPLASATVVVLVTAFGCGAAPDPIPSHYVASGAQIVPASTAQDLATYGDVAVLFTVASESEVPPTQEEIARGEGTITRLVTAKQSGNVLWSRPSRVMTAEGSPPRSWTIADGGWVFHGKTRTPLDVEGRARLVVGNQYLAIRTFSSLGGSTAPEWFSLCYLPVKGGQVAIDRSMLPADATSFQRNFQGLTMAAAVRTLATTHPDPKAQPYMQLDAAHRYEKTVG